MSVSPDASELPPAVRAFDLTAGRFDERFGEWASVSAQREAVRRELTRIFPLGSRLLELGGGTGLDAIHLLERGYRVTLTDGSPRMVELARHKLRAAGFHDAVVERLVLEDCADFERRMGRSAPYDGAYSNFASLNCIPDVAVLGPSLSRLVRPGGCCAFVVFGPYCVGEVVVELALGRPGAAFRRFRRGAAPAKLGGVDFQVWYHSPRALARSLAPWFRLRGLHGIGVLVPPSAAEPWISRFPRAISAMKAMDRMLSKPLALMADHVLIELERTTRAAPPSEGSLPA